MINDITLDSFKIRLPYESIEILDGSLLSKWFLVNEGTGIYDEAEFKNNSLSFNDNGIKTKFAVERQVTKNRSVKTFAIILINSKTLKSQYFSGIKKSNIKRVYKYLISLAVIDFTFEVFLLGEITDVDFKRDRRQKNLKDAINELYAISRLHKNKGSGAKKYIKKNNLGIEFSDRRTTEINNAPFIKIYHKEVELKKGSKDSQLFFKTYLANKKNIDNIVLDRVRVEYTIKNKKHFKIYNIKDTSLKNILNLSFDIKNKMLIDSLSKHLHFELYDIKKRSKQNFTITDLVLIAFIELSLNKNIPYLIIQETVTKNIKEKNARYRMKKKLKRLYNKIEIENNTFVKITDNSISFFNWLFSA